jgi:hypothetical protein
MKLSTIQKRKAFRKNEREGVSKVEMLRQNSQPEEPKKLYVWPWEEEICSPAEYMRALHGLNHFLKDVDIGQLHTLEDVSAVASLLGHDLRIIAMAKGIRVEAKTSFLITGTNEAIDVIEEKYVLTTFIRDREVAIIADAEHVLIAEKYITGFARHVYEVLRVGLPSDRDIAIGGKPNVDEQTLYALDWRSNRGKEYYPTQDPYNTQLQQEFTRVLKDAIGHAKEVVAMLP